jgi:DNA-binding MarR family transcriptional regulator
MTEDESRWLDERQMTAWRGWIEASRRIGNRIDSDLRDDSGLTTDDYEVLVSLSEAEGHRLRMAELARKIVNSPSRLSQRVDRMVRGGLLRRERCEDDKRGWYAVMTEEGLERLKAAAPAHVDSVREHFIDHLSETDIDTLAELMPRLAAIDQD